MRNFILKKIMQRLTGFVPVPTGWLTENVAAICTKYVNLFLYRYQNGFIAIDAGCDAVLVQNGLKILGIHPSQITHVLLTHSDYDHVSGLSVFSDAVVLLAKPEKPLVDKEKARAFLYYNSIKTPISYLEVPVSFTIADIHVAAIFTPGHTIGSTAFIIDGGDIFIGDAASIQNGKLKMFFPLFNMNRYQHKNSIVLLQSLCCGKRLFTAHSGWDCF